MDNTPLKKGRMMDIVRKKPNHREVGSVEKEQRVVFSIEKKRDHLHTEVRKEAKPTHKLPEEIEEVSEREISAKHVEPRILETHSDEEDDNDVSVANRMMPESSSLEFDRPIAYIPKEKQSREEQKVFERIERRERSQRREGSQGGKRNIFVWIASCVLLGIVSYVAVAVLPRAEIMLIAKKTEWNYAKVIGANTKIASVDPTSSQIPVAVFVEKKTNAFQFPATGAGKSIERKATGNVTIYNEFAASTQPLVAGTRLETPDGKIFRLKERVVIPAATISGGELTKASIEVEVIADKAGESYNISPVSKFTIPGFAGTAKFDGFYAESKAAMTGGFIGEGKYPTAEDIKAAKESAEKQMKEVIESFLATQIVPEGFKVIESSRKFAITKSVVNEAVDDQGNFSVYIEAEGGVDALKEEHVLALMTELARQEKADAVLEIKEHTLSYGDITVDAKTGAITLPIDFKGVFWKPIDVEEFKKDVMGKTQDELKAFIFSSTSIERADVALWPGWVKTVPNDAERVKVELQ